MSQYASYVFHCFRVAAVSGAAMANAAPTSPAVHEAIAATAVTGASGRASGNCLTPSLESSTRLAMIESWMTSLLSVMPVLHGKIASEKSAFITPH